MQQKTPLHQLPGNFHSTVYVERAYPFTTGYARSHIRQPQHDSSYMAVMSKVTDSAAAMPLTPPALLTVYSAQSVTYIINIRNSYLAR